MTISYSKAEMMAHDLLTSMPPARRAALRKMLGEEPERPRPELRVVDTMDMARVADEAPAE